MQQPLIDRNGAFAKFFALGTSRSLLALHNLLLTEDPDITPSYDTLKNWSVKFNWQKRVTEMDKAASDGLAKKIIPEWIDIKTDLVTFLLGLIMAADPAVVTPKNARDMAVLISTLRDVLGEATLHKLEAEVTTISYVPCASMETLEAANILAMQLTADNADNTAELPPAPAPLALVEAPPATQARPTVEEAVYYPIPSTDREEAQMDDTEPADKDIEGPETITPYAGATLMPEDPKEKDSLFRSRTFQMS